ncbi:hypothetical protein QQF64_025715 [Cirrhinus molitorella]|uniref:AIG1-type G domain-containing protein n=1 Tax=Cirrhinus molitorella TaxID=172907 RepID=A0ABR3NQN4_9TELE
MQEIRIVVLGDAGVGKSATGNTILGEKVFRSALRMNAITSECSAAHATVSGRSVSVVDTPGFADTLFQQKELRTEIGRSVYLSSPGPHVFLIVFALNMRRNILGMLSSHKIKELFGQEVFKYSIILFTHGDLLEEDPIEKFIKQYYDVKNVVDECGGRFHVFNNKDLNNR